MPDITRRDAMRFIAGSLALGSIHGTGANAFALSHAVFRDGKRPSDPRLGPQKDLNGYFPFTPAKSPEEWAKRADFVRRRVLVAAGLWPKPEPANVEATLGETVERDEYTVTPVRFESTPGLFVTGSLYAPREIDTKRPAILCPHGHWANGRFHDHGDRIKQELESGAEKFEVGGRHPLQARCVQLARMGCIVFHYDMLGYADSAPLSYELSHRFAEQRPDMSEPDHWGLFSAQACLRLINPLGIQTLNSLRALDWIASRSDVDTNRIGITGASGGGTQTFILTAIDDRISAAFPAVMVSTAMQGGCTCENAPLLRIETGNVEFAALTAPRPLGLSAANDWTKEMPTKGIPELRQHYKMLGLPDRVRGEHFEFGHNYNAVSRAYMYDFFEDAFELGLESPIVERDYEPLSVDEMTVWNEEWPKPEATDAAELRVVSQLAANDRERIESLTRTDAKSLDEYRRVVGGAIEVMVGRGLPDWDSIQYDKVADTPGPGYLHYTAKLTLKPNAKQGAGEQLPSTFFYPEAWKGPVAIWIDGRGKQALYDAKGEPIPAVRRLVEEGVSVASVDTLYTGEFLKYGLPLRAWRKVENPREAPAFTLGYNHSLFAQRVHDVLTILSFVRNHDLEPSTVSLIGTSGAGPIVAAAAAVARDAVDKLAVDTDGFRFATITDWRDPNLWPGAIKYGDVPGLLSLAAPTQLWIAGEKAVPEIVSRCYKAAGEPNAAAAFGGNQRDVIDELAEWVIG